MTTDSTLSWHWYRVARRDFEPMISWSHVWHSIAIAGLLVQRQNITEKDMGTLTVMHCSGELGSYTVVCCVPRTYTVWMERPGPQAHGVDRAHNHSIVAAYTVYHWTSTAACCPAVSSVCSFPHTCQSRLSCVTVSESILVSADKGTACSASNKERQTT